MSDSLSSLLPSLVDALTKLGSSPIKLDVSLSDPEEVSRLKEQISSLEAALLMYETKCTRIERLYTHESAINNRLLDYIRDNGLTVPKSIFRVES